MRKITIRNKSDLKEQAAVLLVADMFRLDKKEYVIGPYSTKITKDNDEALEIKVVGYSE